MERRRVVVTGIGLVSPLGVGTERTWSALLAGKSGIGPNTRFDTSEYSSKIVGEIPDLDVTERLDAKIVRRTDPFMQYALIAAEEAVRDSELPFDAIGRERIGVIIGSGIGGLLTIEKNMKILLETGPRRITPFLIPGLAINMAAGQVSIRYGVTGPNSAPATACTTGLHAIGDAFRLIQHGYADAMFAGGSEAPITQLSIAGFCSMRALSTRNDAPEKASRPWDRDRDGFVIGEGAGVLILEELQAARTRGAAIYAEISGYGMSGDAYHVSAPHPEGIGAIKVMRRALADAGIDREHVDYINAHGTSTPLGDLSEVAAIKSVFGDGAYRIAVSSTKSATGHLLGAAGGLESGILALVLRDQVIPATLNLDNPSEDCDLDFVPHTPREAKVDIALTNSFGFGGTNGAIIMSRFTG
ncbi:MAG: beta-ketoacyl-ACP synthase II [Acidobacteria bacterium]|nr:beta-ketoacyl-ACP synthase II [Acidobacteriota bacterium]